MNGPTQIDLLESTALEEIELDEQFEDGLALKEASVDRKSGVINNVTIMNRVSRNGHRYSDAGLEDAVKKFNGARFYLDHPTKSALRDSNGTRSVKDLAGKIVNTRKVGDSVRADIQLLDRKATRELLYSIVSMPELAGNSIRATGLGRKDSTGQFVVDAFKDVVSVDLVTTPAATEGLFESHNRKDAHMDLATLKKDHKDIVDQLRTEIKAEVQDGSELATVKRHLADAQTKTADTEKKLDEASVKLAARDRKDLIATKLADAKLPKSVVTALFQKQLEDAEDEKALDALIADRKALAKSVKSTGPVSTERTITESHDGDVTPIDSARMGDYARQLGVA